MDIYVFSGELLLLGILDDVSRCVCTLRYAAAGTLEAVCANTEHNRALLREGTLLGIRRDRCLQAGGRAVSDAVRARLAGRFDGFLLEGIEASNGDGDFSEGGGDGRLTVSASGLEALLRLRVIPARWDVSGDSGAAIEAAVAAHCVSPSDSARAFPRFLQESGFTGSPVVREGGYETVYDGVRAVAEAAGTGFEVELLPFSRLLRFRQYAGVDRTRPGAEGLLILAENFGNLTESGYRLDRSDWRTTAYVGGEEVSGVRTTEVVNSTPAGLNRRELYVPATDLHSTRYVNGVQTTLTDAQYRALLHSRGEESLAEHGREERVEAGVPQTAELWFRLDYGLGDRVLVRSARFGVETARPISAVTETWANDGYTLSPVLGDEQPGAMRRLAAVLG